MTWAIWIKFLPLSHGGSTWNLASVGPVVSWKIFEQTHTHTHSCTPEHNNWELFQMKKIWGGGGVEGKALYFCGGERRWRGCCFCFVLFFQSSGQLAFVKIYNFLSWWSFSKMQFVQMGSVGMKKKVPKKWVMRVPWWWCWLISWPYRWWFSREVKSRRIHCTTYIPVKPG